MTLFSKNRPTLCSEMFQIKPYADKPNTFGILVDNIKSYERIKKWDGGTSLETSDKSYDTKICRTLRAINLYAVVTMDCVYQVQF